MEGNTQPCVVPRTHSSKGIPVEVSGKQTNPRKIASNGTSPSKVDQHHIPCHLRKENKNDEDFSKRSLDSNGLKFKVR